MVEHGGTTVGDQLERAGQIGLHESGFGCGRHAVHEELRVRGGESGEPLRLACDLTAAWPIQDVPVPRQVDGRCQEVPPR